MRCNKILCNLRSLIISSFFFLYLKWVDAIVFLFKKKQIFKTSAPDDDTDDIYTDDDDEKNTTKLKLKVSTLIFLYTLLLFFIF